MKNNDKITFSREGDQHPDIKIPGDVVIVLQEKKHDRFERRGPLAFDGILGVFCLLPAMLWLVGIIASLQPALFSLELHATLFFLQKMCHLIFRSKSLPIQGFFG